MTFYDAKVTKSDTYVAAKQVNYLKQRTLSGTLDADCQVSTAIKTTAPPRASQLR